MIGRVALTAFTFSLAVAAASARETGGGRSEAPAHPTETTSAYGIPPWVPSWLRVPLRRALADATDPRDRHAPR